MQLYVLIDYMNAFVFLIRIGHVAVFFFFAIWELFQEKILLDLWAFYHRLVFEKKSVSEYT